MSYYVYRNYSDPITFDEFLESFDTLEEAKDFKYELACSDGADREAMMEAEEELQIVPEFDEYINFPSDYPGPGSWTWCEFSETWIPYVSPASWRAI